MVQDDEYSKFPFSFPAFPKIVDENTFGFEFPVNFKSKKSNQEIAENLCEEISGEILEVNDRIIKIRFNPIIMCNIIRKLQLSAGDLEDF